MSDKTHNGQTGLAALLVATGILLSRIAGLIRDRAFAHYFGNTDAADAFRAALRIPNFLQNLFGEGVLSASFIPVYAGMLARGQRQQATRLVEATAGVLGLIVSCIVLLGLLTAPVLTDLFAPGFSGQKRQLTITMVRILFPGTGILVMSALCLGILNSHRRFFVSYAAPVMWNGAIIAALLYCGPKVPLPRLAIMAAWGAVFGSLLQIAVQIPQVMKAAGLIRPSMDIATEGLRYVLVNAIPVIIGRGVVQISGYVDSIIASFLPSGSLAALGYAQTLYLLPVSLFGMSVSAAELPALSSDAACKDGAGQSACQRLHAGLRRIAYLVVPSTVGFVALGDLIVGAIYRSGRFGPADAGYVWAILAAASIGLPASTLSRLYSAAFYALGDTRTPLRFSLVRVATATMLGLAMAFWLPSATGISERWGIVGLAAGSAMAAIIEYSMLKRGINRRLGRIGLSPGFLMLVWLAALSAAMVVTLTRPTLVRLHPVAAAGIAVPTYGLVYLIVTRACRIPEANVVTLWQRRVQGSREL